ncbi:hypothetical protein ACTJIJ_16750 [Niabella sp. 22666]
MDNNEKNISFTVEVFTEPAMKQVPVLVLGIIGVEIYAAKRSIV